MSQKISLFICGAQKCGTTSLKNYLGEHPDINGQVQTEMLYFTREEEFLLGYENAYQKYFLKEKHDTSACVAKYVSFSQSDIGLQRLKMHNPECKIIYMVREPVQRSFSSFLMEQSTGEENRTFDQAIEETLNNEGSWQYRAFISYGFYIEHIKNILKYFDKNNVRVIVLEELKADPQYVLSDLFEWIGVDKEFFPDITKVHNQGGEKKYQFYRKILRFILNENFFLKRLLKKLLPEQLLSKIGFELRQLNKNKNIKATISDETMELLSNIYIPYNNKLSLYMGCKNPIWKN